MIKMMRLALLCLLLCLLAYFITKIDLNDYKYLTLFIQDKIVRHEKSAASELSSKAPETAQNSTVQKEVDPDYSLARQLFDQQKYEEALLACHKALEKEPENPQYNQLCGASALQLKEYDMAVAYFKRGVNGSRNDYYAYNGMAYAYLRKNDYRNALENLDRALKAAPENAYSYLLKGYICDDLGEYDKNAKGSNAKASDLDY